MSDTQKDATSSPNDDTTSEARYTGRVKWFNNRAGFGFITVLEGEHVSEDIFVHHSGIQVDTEQYKYLVQGEYVTFELRSSDNTEHPYQAGNIRGVAMGPLMCETRLTMRKVNSEEDGQQTRPRRRVRRGGSGPREERSYRGGNWSMDKNESSRGKSRN